MKTAAQVREALFDEGFLRRVEALHLLARKVLSGRARAERRGRRIGSGIEYADHRDYAPGDDPRYLDWGAYGRLGKLLLRLFEEEEDLYVYLLFDASGSMALRGDEARPSKFDQARRIAAALAYIALANFDRAGVVPLGGSELGDREARGSVRGRGQIFRLLDELASCGAGGPTDLRAGVDAFLRRGPRRGLAVVLSDFFDPAGYEGALDLLRYHRFETAVVQLVDPADARPEAVGDAVLVDCESGERLEVTLTPRMVEEVARAHATFCDKLAAFCGARAMVCVRAETGVPFDELVLRFLRERGLLS